jgi:hypothetical protein
MSVSWRNNNGWLLHEISLSLGVKINSACVQRILDKKFKLRKNSWKCQLAYCPLCYVTSWIIHLFAQLIFYRVGLTWTAHSFFMQQLSACFRTFIIVSHHRRNNSITPKRLTGKLASQTFLAAFTHYACVIMRQPNSPSTTIEPATGREGPCSA